MIAFESIIQGLNEAFDHAQGKATGAIIHRIEVPSVDIAAIRASTGLSQGAFAGSIGVAKGHCSIGTMAAGTLAAPRKCCLP